MKELLAHNDDMCLSVFLRTRTELPEIGWNEVNPSFNARELRGRDRRPFVEPHVYDLGTDKGCACGFMTDGEDPANPLIHRSLSALRDYVERAVATDPHTLVNISWFGEQSKTASERVVSLSDLLSFDFWKEIPTQAFEGTPTVLRFSLEPL
jgi:hypothetical protein